MPLRGWAEASAGAIVLSAVATAAGGDNAISGDVSDIGCWGDSLFFVIILGAKDGIRKAETVWVGPGEAWNFTPVSICHCQKKIIARRRCSWRPHPLVWAAAVV